VSKFEHSYCIDQLRIYKEKICVVGWSLKSSETDTLLFILPDSKEISLHSRDWRKPSPDIMSAFGNSYSENRFEIEIPLPKDISLSFFYNSKIRFNVNNKKYDIPLIEKEEKSGNKFSKKINELKIGIGIPTYNRNEILEKTLNKIKENTSIDYILFVSDDGSKSTIETQLEKFPGFYYGVYENRGIAWNKNRILFFLKEIQKCDIIIVMEDDTYPAVTGWDIEWILATLMYGHVNFAPSYFKSYSSGDGSWSFPFKSTMLTGQCSSFLDETLSYVGYFDSRFGKYGHEHVEHTMRMIKMGYGGNLIKKEDRAEFYLIQSGLGIVESVSNHSEEEVKKNAAVFDSIKEECVYRSAWRSDEDILLLREEMGKIKRSVLWSEE